MKEIYKVVLKKNKVLGKKLEGIKETKTSFVIENHPLKCFDKNTIKKVKISEGYIYIGDLKEEYKTLKGSGYLSRFMTTVKDKAQTFFSPKTNDYNNTTKRMLAKYGNIPIESMAIYRTPLPSLLSKAINVLSLGQWNKLQKKYGFDKFYHLALVITLKSGKNIIVEKNEVIEVKDSYKTNSDTETLPIKNMKPGYTINYLLENARRQVGDDKTYFSYDPFTNNCQVFIKNILSANGYYDKAAEEFLFQNIEELVKELNPITKSIMRATTDVAAVANKVLGKGKEELDIKEKKKFLLLFNRILRKEFKLVLIKTPSKLVESEINEIFDKIFELRDGHYLPRKKVVELDTNGEMFKQIKLKSNKTPKPKKKSKKEVEEDRKKKEEEDRKKKEEEDKKKKEEEDKKKEEEEERKKKEETQRIRLDITPVLREEGKEDLNEALKFMENYKSDVSPLEFLKTNIGMKMYFIYILERHKNDCLSINTKRNTKAIEWIFINKVLFTNYSDYKDDNSFIERDIKHCIEAKKRFLAIPLTLSKRNSYHQNMIVLDLVKMTAERFEPHGGRTGGLLETVSDNLDKVLKKKFEKDLYKNSAHKYKFTYIPPSELCPNFTKDVIDRLNEVNNDLNRLEGKKIGYQAFENREPSEDPGWCVAWALFYLDTRLSAPSYTPQEIYKNIFNRLNSNPKEFLRFIRGYSKFLSEFYNKIYDDFLEKHPELKGYSDLLFRGSEASRKKVEAKYREIGEGEKNKMFNAFKKFLNNALIEVAGDGKIQGSGILEDIMKREQKSFLVGKFYKQKTSEVIDYIPFFIEKYNDNICLYDKLLRAKVKNNETPTEKNNTVLPIRGEEGKFFEFEKFKTLPNFIKKCPKRLVILLINLDPNFYSDNPDDKANHQTGLIIDKETKKVEYFDPHGSYDPEAYGNRYAPELEAAFNQFFSKLGYDYLFMEDTCPLFREKDMDKGLEDKKILKDLEDLVRVSREYNTRKGFQAIELLTGNTYAGFCFSWTWFYIESRIEDPDIDPLGLKKKIMREFKGNPSNYLDFILKYATYLIEETATPEERIKIEKAKEENTVEEEEKKKEPEQVELIRKKVNENKKITSKEYRIMINANNEEIEELNKEYYKNQEIIDKPIDFDNPDEELMELQNQLDERNMEIGDLLTKRKNEIIRGNSLM